MTQPLLRAVSSEPRPEAQQGLGATLRALRETRGASLAEVSARLKFSTRQIEALENEQWDILPKGVSLRGMVKNYGRFLDANVEALLVMLDSQVETPQARPLTLSDDGPTISHTELPLHVESGQRSWGWLLVILILLAVAGFYAIERGWVPDSWLVFDWLKTLKR